MEKKNQQKSAVLLVSCVDIRLLESYFIVCPCLFQHYGVNSRVSSRYNDPPFGYSINSYDKKVSVVELGRLGI